MSELHWIRTTLRVASLVILFHLHATVVHADFNGKVVSVYDGDTIAVLHDQRPERIRLYGIDCPEKGQAYGTRARQATAGLIYGKDVTLHIHDQDKYGRTVADVLLPDGTNINQELVKDGWCWWYRRYAPADTTLIGHEIKARAAKRGLWADPDQHPVAPWKWRKAKLRQGDVAH